MKAYLWSAYGAPDVLRLEERPVPTPGANEILVRNIATSVFAGDCELRSWQILPSFTVPMRLALGVRRPKRVQTLGQEFSGVVTAVGNEVTGFKPGQTICGPTIGFGAYAEYHCVASKLAVVEKPEGISHSEAAVLAVGGMNALAFHRLANIQPGQQVLLVGAGGSIGTFSLQLAKMAGATVTVVDTADKLERLQALGADHAIDFERQDLAALSTRFDVVINIHAKSRFFTGVKLLKPTGTLLLMNFYFGQALATLYYKLFSKKSVKIGLAGYDKASMQTLVDWVAAGKLKVVIDREFAFTELPAAHAYVDSGKKFGNLAIRFPD